ncbi:MAG TPA: RsmE family RNA methyltransferase [Puia sp.]|jgi:16S rRNA (uracil1498-N3)-methyltransferase|nr:RsmE family RNA methyltransferase [Puia sp.]
MLPYFYVSSVDAVGNDLVLDEDNSRHIVQVLRMKPGQKLQLTDGKGALLTATIVDDHKKKCRVRVDSIANQAPPERQVAIAISPLKNASRFEWFLEKATEIGVTTIIPLLSERTERQHHRPDRWRGILVSALLQSQQAWLPVLPVPVPFAQLVVGIRGEGGLIAGVSGEDGPIAGLKADQRLIAHCLDVPRPTESLAGLVRTKPAASTLILIGPEGDFSATEVELALAGGFVPVTLGKNRLRTETAGVVAASLLCA